MINEKGLANWSETWGVSVERFESACRKLSRASNKAKWFAEDLGVNLSSQKMSRLSAFSSAVKSFSLSNHERNYGTGSESKIRYPKKE